MSGPFVLSPNSAFLLLQRMCCYSGVKKRRVAEISESLCDSGHQWLRRGGQPNGDNRHRNVCECCVWAGFEVLESRSDLSYRCAAALDIPSELASIKSIFSKYRDFPSDVFVAHVYPINATQEMLDMSS